MVDILQPKLLFVIFDKFYIRLQERTLMMYGAHSSIPNEAKKRHLLKTSSFKVLQL